MKIAHISDIHFFEPTLSLKNIFSNRIVGMINAYINRRHFFITKHLDKLIDSLCSEEVDTLVISGDFTTTTSEKELQKASEFINKVKACGIAVYALPGNHDVYTKKDFEEGAFYNALDIPPYSHKKVHHQPLNENWDLFLLDTTIFNPLGFANGQFFDLCKTTLASLLNSGKNVIIANHFPIGDIRKSRKLINRDNLKKLLYGKQESVLYLHGHTHKTECTFDKNIHIFNSSQVTVKDQFRYHIIELLKNDYRYKEVKYHD